MFFYIKQVKFFNDKNNKIRENIIFNIIKNIIPDEWYILQPLWNNLKIKLENIIKNIGINIYYNNLDIELKGGRNFNYDFIIYYKLNENNVLFKNIEFKYNTTKINKYPLLIIFKKLLFNFKSFILSYITLLYSIPVIDTSLNIVSIYLINSQLPQDGSNILFILFLSSII